MKLISINKFLKQSKKLLSKYYVSISFLTYCICTIFYLCGFLKGFIIILGLIIFVIVLVIILYFLFVLIITKAMEGKERIEAKEMGITYKEYQKQQFDSIFNNDKS